MGYAAGTAGVKTGQVIFSAETGILGAAKYVNPGPVIR